MKIRLRNVLALVMAAVMMLSAFSFASYAVAPNAFGDIQTITSNTFDVTIINNSHSMYYKFIPSQTGYYYLSVGDVEDASFTYYDSEFNELGYSYIGNCCGNYRSFLYFTAGSTYYIEVSAYSDAFPLTFTANLCYLGVLDKAEIISLPYKLTYIQGYYENWEMSQSDEDDCYINFDLDGLELYLAFSGGSVFRLYGYDIYQQFVLSYPNTHIGTNTVALTIMGQYITSFNFELIENPVSSIEIVQTPCKHYYRYAKDGDFYLRGWFYGWFYPSVEAEGLKVKINYIDGTSKIVEFGEYDSNGLYIDDYYMGVYTDNCDIGDNEVSVYYLNHTATFTISVINITLFEKVLIYIYDLFERYNPINWS